MNADRGTDELREDLFQVWASLGFWVLLIGLWVTVVDATGWDLVLGLLAAMGLGVLAALPFAAVWLVLWHALGLLASLCRNWVRRMRPHRSRAQTDGTTRSAVRPPVPTTNRTSHSRRFAWAYKDRDGLMEVVAEGPWLTIGACALLASTCLYVAWFVQDGTAVSIGVGIGIGLIFALGSFTLLLPLFGWVWMATGLSLAGLLGGIVRLLARWRRR